MPRKRYYTDDEIWDLVGETFTLSNEHVRGIMTHLLTRVPKEVVDFLTKHCLVTAEWPEGGASHIPNKAIDGKDLIFLSDQLLESDEREITETILHECAHCWLKHKSPLLENFTPDQAQKQEEEASAIAKKWMRRRSRI